MEGINNNFFKKANNLAKQFVDKKIPMLFDYPKTKKLY